MARRRGISRQDVINAAADVCDAEGIEGVTLASVAARLGIRPPSLYAHVDGLAGLRRLLALHAAERMAAAFDSAVGSRRGLDALRALAVEYRRFALANPGLYAAAQGAVRPDEDEELYRALATVVVPAFRALAEAGVPATEQVHVTRAIRSALHGFVRLEQNGGFGMPDSVDESFRRVVDLLVSAVTAVAGGSPAP